MANTQTTVPAFVASQVLTAAEMTQSASTGVPVFATTVTRDAGFGGSGQKALAQGQLCYLEATDVVQYYDGSAWATLAPAPPAASGLTLISSNTFTAVSTFTVSNCFSATYKNYKVFINSATVGASTPNFQMRFGSATANYTYADLYCTNAITWTRSGGSASASQINLGIIDSTTQNHYSIDILNPFEAKFTTLFAFYDNYSDNQWGNTNAQLKDTDSHTSLTLLNSGAETMTGTLEVYGYAI
jgi:hypothetical protein